MSEFIDPEVEKCGLEMMVALSQSVRKMLRRDGAFSEKEIEEAFKAVSDIRVYPCNSAILEAQYGERKMTHTYAIMKVSRKTYDEIYNKLKAAGYSDQINQDGDLDMHGIALAEEEGIYDKGGFLDDGKI